MAKRYATIEEALSQFDTSGTPVFEMAGTYDEENITVFSQGDFLTVCSDFFSERKFWLKDDSASDAAITTFTAFFNAWKSRVSADYIRAFYALKMEYNPIENYNSVEDKKFTHGKKVDNKYGHKISTKNNQKESITDTPNQYEKTTKTEIYGYNSAVASPSDLVTENETGTKTRDITYAGEPDTVTHSGTDTVTNSGDDKEHNTKSGNIGVTTTQAMISEELRLRLQDIRYKAIKKFIDAYTIY